MQSPHKSVLLNEVKDIFSNLDGTFIDCTLGYAGHSYAILKNNPNLNLIACDRDNEAIEFSKKKLEEFKDRVKIYKSNFSELLNKISDDNKKNIRAILADIGVSSLQIDKDDRGFSINSDTLDMRMDQNNPISAFEIVNNYTYDELSRIFFEYGELKNARNIAQKIITARNKAPIKSAKQLAKIIGTNSIKGRNVSQAILAFQAIRIEVNKELDELKNLLNLIKKSGIKNCLVCIISFHSLEDRIVKSTFKDWQTNCICPPNSLRCECGNNNSIGKILTKKAIQPTKEEIFENSRSSCAKMRAFMIR
ncbi:16S rRNA (cytosine(1402)-N(4))-methyltransferase RsmH [Campylobacter pinnipediorum]|uniref:16S rRNA (cytosine(1402)-N(4))-methyltransferase RsmH n=1 Tax=Campylobacter pinnipediorum TaxID=1965231 RepID=UPI0009959DA9|nr:16S rRNA (cytosine(1402)-N(4))-methyltransferase RsmH [Campylobacter pinnipediorum]AQW82940.1 16S rRNA m4C1402 methyltransferase [Campylobacter pinnipediorum subsp. pinnipediorum]